VNKLDQEFKKGNVYSTSKPIYHTKSIETLRNGEQPYPVHVEIVISDFCNHDCGFCAYRMSGYSSNELFQIEEGNSRKARNPRRMIDKQKCFEILDDCEVMGVKAIQFTGGGEPTVHPDFVEIVTYALDKGFEVALVTNGNMLINKSHRDVVKRLKWVRVSIDSSTPEYYSEERGVGIKAWDRLEEGIKELKKDLSEVEHDVVLGAGFVVTDRNWKQIYDAVRLYKEWGFDNVRIGLMFNPEGSKPYEAFRYDMNYLAIKAVEDFSDNRFTVINRVSEKYDELDKGNPDFEFCSYQHFTQYIGGDLNLYRCCVYAYNKHGLVGSIKNMRFKELLDSESKKKNMEDFKATSCERCQFTEIIKNTNSFIESEEDRPVGIEPLHINFT